MSRAGDGRRLFVALWPDADVRLRLAALQQRVSTTTGLMQGAVAVENLHMTLRFFGKVPAADIESLKASMSTVSFEPFHLEIDRWGQFPKPGILWAGPERAPDMLFDMQRELSLACDGFGDAAKEKRFRAHVTLFRKVRHLPVLEGFDAIEWLIDRIVLVESLTRPEGVRYRVIAEHFAN